jgi:hypothetical protein
VIGYDAAARYTELVRRLTGEEDFVPPGLILELDRLEWAVLKREIPWSIQTSVTAVVGAFGVVQVENQSPTTIGSKRLVVVQQFGGDVGLGGGTTVRAALVNAIGLQGTGPVQQALNVVTPRDSRLYNRNPTVKVRTYTVTALNFGTGSMVEFSDNQESSKITWPILVAPGHSLFFAGVTANVAVAISIMGYERPAREEEFAEV